MTSTRSRNATKVRAATLKENDLAEEHSFPIKLVFHNSDGFHLTTSAQLIQENQMPIVFKNVTVKRKVSGGGVRWWTQNDFLMRLTCQLLKFTTLALLKLNVRIKESLLEIFLMSDQ